MNHNATLIVIVFTLLLGTVGFAAEPAPIRVMSFNVRNSGMDDWLNAWKLREPLFFETIKNDAPDLIGFQEVLADQHDSIAAHLPDYQLSGVARDDGKRAGEWALIAYRTSRFEKLAEGNFWLSEHPDEPGSKSWDAACTRICSWVTLKDRTNNREFLFANTHWDHVGITARMKSAEMIKQRLPALSKSSPVILTGDLNSTEDDAWVQSLLHPADEKQVRLLDSYREVHPKREEDERTFHDFTGDTKGSRIDFILHSPEFTAAEASIDHHHSTAGRYPSDHFPVVSVIRFEQP